MFKLAFVSLAVILLAPNVIAGTQVNYHATSKDNSREALKETYDNLPANAVDTLKKALPQYWQVEGSTGETIDIKLAKPMDNFDEVQALVNEAQGIVHDKLGQPSK